MIETINIILIALMLIMAVVALRVPCLMSATFALGAYSFFLANLFAALNAADVSFTEAMVGVGASTIFLILGIVRTNNKVKDRKNAPISRLAAGLTLALGAFFIWGSLDLPAFGDAASAASTYLSPYYLQNAYLDSHTPNAVTAVVVDYRSFDTLIEATVVFTAGVACLFIVKEKV